MRCRNCGRELKDGVKFCPGCGTPVTAETVPEPAGQSALAEQPARPEQKERSSRSKIVIGAVIAAVAVAVVALVLVLTNAGRDQARFASPLEYYRYVESAAAGTAGERLDAYGGALREAFDISDRRVDMAAELELYDPARSMLQTYTGEDYAWLKTLSLSAGVDLTEEGEAIELSLSLNGRELLGAEILADTAAETLYGRIPLLSEDHFQTGFDEAGINRDDFAYFERMKELSGALPDAGAFSDLLSRCAEAALARIETVEQGSDTLSAGGVSAQYTTLTATLTEEQLRAVAEDVGAVLREDAALEDFILALEDLTGEACYDDFLYELDHLPDRIVPDEALVMTLYVDGDDAIRGRTVEYDGTVLRYAAPEEDGRYGLELFREDLRDAEAYDSVAGGWTERGDVISGSFNVTARGTEYMTLGLADLDAEHHTGTFTLRPTYDFYTELGVYSLTARALEDFYYVLEADGDDAVLDVHMGGEPFLTLTLHTARGSAEALPAISDAADLRSWAMSLLLRGGLNDYLDYLRGSDLPPALLDALLGSVF